MVIAAAIVAVPAAIAAGVVHGSGPSASQKPVAHHPHLVPVGQSPLRVRGTGFVSRERVRLKASDQTRAVLVVRANRRGRFGATFRGFVGCDSVTVSAVGSKGSRASFNLSQIVCLQR